MGVFSQANQFGSIAALPRPEAEKGLEYTTGIRVIPYAHIHRIEQILGVHSYSRCNHGRMHFP
jgi:hypothetical protein